MLRLTGIHHVSALTNDIQGNHDFYTGVMGLRLVKKTVNQDDPSMYHLFYADALGSAGTDMTFFDMPLAARERRGNRSISRTTFRVNGEASLRYWEERLAAHGVSHSGVTRRDGRLHLDFEDKDGFVASLVDDGGVGDAHPWDLSPVPAEHQIRGLGYSVITVPELGPTHDFLTGVFNLRASRTYPHPESPSDAVHVYLLQGEGPAAEVHVAVRPGLGRTRYGSGGVHHVALRVPNDEQYHLWTRRLEETGMAFSGEVDRYYFRSLYIREPGGILFELATDGPGFSSDEPTETMGQTLALPPFLEPDRAKIEAKLKPLGGGMITQAAAPVSA